jgi:hypothetical protein
MLALISCLISTTGFALSHRRLSGAASGDGG